MTEHTLDIADVRRRFSSLTRPFVFLDAPGGSQVPDSVGDAVATCLRESSANLGAVYETSRRVGEILTSAEQGAAAFLGCDPDEIVFGPNMTSLNFALSRTAARDFEPGDEILVSSLDHDGGVAPWRELAEDRGLVLQHIGVRDDTTLDYDDLAEKLTERTRIVAFSWASNAVGTISDAARVCQMAHEAGALAWVDAVHYAAHSPIDVRAIGADVLFFSAYKICGPHVGVAFARREVAERWRPYKVKPAPTDPLGRRFETGCLAYELLAGFNATMEYLGEIGGWDAIMPYERSLGQRFIDRLPEGVKLYGLPTMDGRVTTFLIDVEAVPSADAVLELAERGFGLWAHDTWYSLELHPRLAYDGDTIRVGFFHYNTVEEVDRFVDEIADLAGR